MIEILHIVSTSGQGHVRQALNRPAIYLDTWAIRHFAETKSDGDQFREALLRAGGTLVLSSIGIVEFAQFEEEECTRAAGIFIDSILPNLFFARFDPFEIRRRESSIMTKQTDQSPFGDEDMLAQFAADAALRGRLSAQHWFRWIYEERVRLRATLPGLAQSIFEGLNGLIERHDKEPGFAKVVKNSLDDADGPRATLALARTIFANLQLDRTMTQDQNNAIDICQTIVPAAYCDFVLLDKQWDHRLRLAARSIRKAGLQARVAQSYSRKSIKKFLTALEALPAAKP